jgi:hypothetical protein
MYFVLKLWCKLLLITLSDSSVSLLLSVLLIIVSILKLLKQICLHEIITYNKSSHTTQEA